MKEEDIKKMRNEIHTMWRLLKSIKKLSNETNTHPRRLKKVYNDLRDIKKSYQEKIKQVS